MKAKCLDCNLFMSDVIAFKESIPVNTTAKLLSNYLTKYQNQNILSTDDILSMFLISAITVEESDVVEKCLSLLSDGNTLTTIDKTGYSAITNMLYSGNPKIQSLFDKYLANKPAITNKVQTYGDDFNHIVTALAYPRLEQLSTEACIEKYMDPLYSPECLGKIQDKLFEFFE